MATTTVCLVRGLRTNQPHFYPYATPNYFFFVGGGGGVLGRGRDTLIDMLNRHTCIFLIGYEY